MKNLRLLLLLSLAILFMYSCRKDNSGPPSANPKVPIKIEDLSVKPTFDWKTSVQYKFTLTSKSNHAVEFKYSVYDITPDTRLRKISSHPL
jgi:hypothetical protein